MATLESRSAVLEPKDPDDIKTYALNLVDKLPTRPTAATISSASIVGTSEPAGLTLSAASVSGTYVTVSVSGGTQDVDYEVTIRTVLSDGQQWDHTIVIPCRKR
jgi:hypothetical protein